MNKFFISALIIMSSAAISQELDDAYLASLPESVRNDVLQNIETRNDLEKPLYRRQSSMTNKPDIDSNRFGDKIFDMMQSSFMPINEPNFDSSYVIDFGDVIEIQFIGQKNLIEKFSVKRNGSINIPQIGQIFISGLSLDTITEIIKSKVDEAYIGVEAFVSLINIRDIQVLITGSAYNPGIYTLNGNSNILHALSMAGGVDEFGSYRYVDLVRGDKIINTIDLYDIFIQGKANFGGRLRSGDSIVVRPALKMVTISGAVKRPGLYELREDEDFSDLLNYSNNFTDSANKSDIKIFRLDKDNVTIIESNGDIEFLSTPTISGDRLHIGSYYRKTVTIGGAIKSPGTYIISQNETLSGLIKKADGYKKNAYPFGGILNNKEALRLNSEAIEKLYSSYIKKLITVDQALYASDSLPFVLDELKKSNPSGRVIAEFDIDVLIANPDLDTSLNDGDQILIPFKTEQVYIFGEINNPGAVRYKSGQSIKQYIQNLGGPLQSADENNIYVVHPNGEVKIFSRTNLSFINKNDLLVYPGSVIYIPRKVKLRNPSTIAAIWAPIISGLATSITALSILDKN
jgi:protein involved in polysaccharide export with SLBB domain